MPNAALRGWLLRQSEEHGRIVIPETTKQKTVALKDDKEFLQYAENNLWMTRKSRGFTRNTDVFQFIHEVYKDYIGNGLLQSDLKHADKAVYAEMVRKVYVTRLEGKPLPAWFERDLPKEFSEQGLKVAFPDAAQRERVSIYREVERERKAAAKARHIGSPPAP